MESRGWYALCVVSAVLLAGLTLQQCGTIFDQIEDMPRMVIPGSHTFQLAADEYFVFGEDTSEVAGKRYENTRFTFESPCTMVDAANRTIEMGEMTPGERKYSITRFRGRSMYEVTIPTSGRYTLRCDGDGTGTAVIAVGHGQSQLSVVWFLALSVGTVLVPWFLFGHVKERRRQAARADA